MPRFFVPSENFGENTVKITGDDAHHIARVLRMAVGDKVTVCDMHGSAHDCVLTKIRDDESELDILGSVYRDTESPVKVTLFMGYPKGDKLELITQKAVELGACRIIPFESSRCVKRPKAEKTEKQTERLCRIAEEAAKQCGRLIIPQVCQPLSYKNALALAMDEGLRIVFCYEGDDTVSMKSVLKTVEPGSGIALFVGTEGGFSLDEVTLAKEYGAVAVNLGPRILRCETAPLYALSAISYHFEL